MALSGVLGYALADSLRLGFVSNIVLPEEIASVDHMTVKKLKLILLSITLLITFFFFVKYLVLIISYFKNPLAFSILPIFVCIFLLFVILFHIGGFVLVADSKKKVRKVEDVEEWWTKWDRV